jgi:hypothetical protein
MAYRDEGDVQLVGSDHGQVDVVDVTTRWSPRPRPHPSMRKMTIRSHQRGQLPRFKPTRLNS